VAIAKQRLQYGYLLSGRCLVLGVYHNILYIIYVYVSNNYMIIIIIIIIVVMTTSVA
jgi:hypothetical protein